MNNTEIYYSPKQGRLPLFITDFLNICDPVLAFDKIMEERAFKKHFEKIELVNSRTSHLYLWTEKGALLHAKSLNTDKAWEVYDYLVDFYFRAKKQLQSQTPETQICCNKCEVVDMPQNVEGQQIIQNIRKRIFAMDVLLDELNRYASKDTYARCRNGINEVFTSLVPYMNQFCKSEPKLIEKPY